MAIQESVEEIRKPKIQIDAIKDAMNKVHMRSREASGSTSPKGELESSSSSASVKDDSDKGFTAATAAAVAAFNQCGPPVREFIDNVKRKSKVDRLSNSTISMLSSYDFSAKSIRQRFGRIWSTDDDLRKQLRSFAYSELAAATKDFSPDRLLGKGGNAVVYKGNLPDGTAVAVKKLMKKSDNEEEKAVDFLSELGIMAHVNHPNTTKLLGFGIERGHYLVVQFSPHGNLRSFLQESAESLEWEKRWKVVLGVAEGLSYLHHTCKRRIIHRDITASNILLNEDYEPSISDFGLAKWLPDKWLHHVVFPIEGTLGYLAPEYFMHGIADEKTDVYAYGVLMLEILTGRRAVEVGSTQNLVTWAKPFLETNNMKELVDPRLEDNYDPEEMRRAMVGASMCIRHSPETRPYMNTVVEILRGVAEPIEPAKPVLTSPRAPMLDSDYPSSKIYFQDLDRQRELVME